MVKSLGPCRKSESSFTLTNYNFREIISSAQCGTYKYVHMYKLCCKVPNWQLCVFIICPCFKVLVVASIFNEVKLFIEAFKIQ